ncbi:class I SAM-dependent methyltransferase [Synechococcus elongatus IITB4]|uniref:class I SAM-dependent methyltransferase n=1 Tax=Synechococcus elongatus TaxID=32046 RepID=UPI0030CE3D79
MMDCDYQYVQTLVDQGLLSGRILELGCGYGGKTCEAIFSSLSGCQYYTSDIPNSPYSTDYEIDFLSDDFKVVFDDKFDVILVLNVLEHVFDPVTFLDRALNLLSSHGSLILLSPVAWPIHHYPFDCVRLLPDFYREYARRRQLIIVDGTFQYVSSGILIPSKTPKNESLPRVKSSSSLIYIWSRFIHKVFMTDGRKIYTLPTPQEAIAIALRKA